MAPQLSVPVDPRLEAEFDRAFAALQQLVDFRQVDQRHPVSPQAVYTTSVVLWMLVYQRLNPDVSLEAAVKKLIEAQPTLLPQNKRVREGTLSTATGAYSRARSRLPCEAAEGFCRQVSQSLIEACPPSYRGRRVFLIDGTTFTLAPEAELQADFPPATNQYGPGVWPVALLVVAHELSSGAALLPEVGAMYGPQAVSETALVDRCLAQLPPEGIALADAGFGIFAVAYAARQAQRRFVLRMTQARFEALRRQATLVAEGSTWTSYDHTWRPSAQDRRSHPELPQDAELSVRLHQIAVHEELTLCLVTDLRDEADTIWALAKMYQQRGEVEIDLRNLKVVLQVETIRAKSGEMFQKELWTSLVAYNLVTQFRRQAAALANQPPRRMSFKRTWTTFRQFLLSAMFTEAAPWRERYRLALHYALRDKLPHRLGRTYAREAYSRRPKSAQFKKRSPKRNTS